MSQLKILVTGSNGFIGSALCCSMMIDFNVIGVDIEGFVDGKFKNNWGKADVTDSESIKAICDKYIPDVVIHCAGIAHQKIGSVDHEKYIRVNSEATENLARAAASSNMNVHFIFLSTISVYGERDLDIPVTEDSTCRPTSAYGLSKLDAEKRLIALFENDILKRLTILRLAPVYDRGWSLNIDRRVFAPKNLAYLRFGRGEQLMTALARPNLVDFVSYLLNHYKDMKIDGCTLNIFNVSDAKEYSFKQIINVFKKSGKYSGRPVIYVPLYPVRLLTRFMGMLFKDNRDWWHACYYKVSTDLVFDNSRMLSTGFSPRHSMETVFLNAQDNNDR